jgi:transcriptional regulator with XRE-family HTH domain
MTTQITITIDEYVGRHVKEARFEKKMTQDDLAQKLGMSFMNISHLENGRRHWKVETLEQVASVFSKEIAWFLPKTMTLS